MLSCSSLKVISLTHSLFCMWKCSPDSCISDKFSPPLAGPPPFPSPNKQQSSLWSCLFVSVWLEASGGLFLSLSLCCAADYSPSPRPAASTQSGQKVWGIFGLHDGRSFKSGHSKKLFLNACELGSNFSSTCPFWCIFLQEHIVQLISHRAPPHHLGVVVSQVVPSSLD